MLCSPEGAEVRWVDFGVGPEAPKGPRAAAECFLRELRDFFEDVRYFLENNKLFRYMDPGGA